MGFVYNLLDFFDSPDIAEFNRYTRFTPAEQAVLIARCEKQTITAKYEALLYLLQTYSESEFGMERVIRDWRLHKSEESLIDSIVKKLSMWKEAIHSIERVEPQVIYAVLLDSQELRQRRYFSSYEGAYEYLEQRMGKKNPPVMISPVYRNARIQRIVLDAPNSREGEFTYRFNSELDMVGIHAHGDKYVSELDLAKDFYVYVPIPFKEGDSVKAVSIYTDAYHGICSKDKVVEPYFSGTRRLRACDDPDMLLMKIAIEPCDGTHESGTIGRFVDRLQLQYDNERKKSKLFGF